MSVTAGWHQELSTHRFNVSNIPVAKHLERMIAMHRSPEARERVSPHWLEASALLIPPSTGQSGATRGETSLLLSRWQHHVAFDISPTLFLFLSCYLCILLLLFVGRCLGTVTANSHSLALSRAS